MRALRLARTLLLAGAACPAGLPQLVRADDGGVVHAMRRGDTVWGVSVRHGVDARALADMNRIDDVRALPVGLRLVLPGPTGDDASARARQALAEALWTLRGARFEEALEAAAQARGACEDLDDAEGSALRVQLDLVSASAELAYGRREAALAHLESALRLEPALTLDPSTTSPKIVGLLEEARGVAARRGGGAP